MGSNLLRAGSWLVVLTTAAWGQTYSDNVRVELANLRQDTLLLTQRVGELSMTVEQLTRDNSSLQNKANQSYATIEQLNKAVADINRTLQAGLAEQKRDTLNQVSAQMERLARQHGARRSAADLPPLHLAPLHALHIARNHALYRL